MQFVTRVDAVMRFIFLTALKVTQDRVEIRGFGLFAEGPDFTGAVRSIGRLKYRNF